MTEPPTIQPGKQHTAIAVVVCSSERRCASRVSPLLVGHGYVWLGRLSHGVYGAAMIAGTRRGSRRSAIASRALGSTLASMAIR